jgi:hypothetical protein
MRLGEDATDSEREMEGVSNRGREDVGVPVRGRRHKDSRLLLYSLLGVHVEDD